MSFGTSAEDSDCELELLALDNGAQIFGDHELKTAPLVIRDVTSLSDGFVQRALLGKVLSVHSNGIPSRTQDSRIYMNLDAPSSGLVCGVQGSGKSHTVSCLIESALMVNRKIGTLPAPLASIVFHFDEENGGRPCEAAFLSELQDGISRAVKEVVILVSPSNLNTRKAVYKGLKYVHVEALRIAEKDINAARMLSMMGADDLEKIPLYLHTALSLLREMGSDNFTYGAFRERLSDSEFNQSQMAMLQLRLDLLDSFLQGNGGDVSFFFKPGRLVIIDLSDPFVDGTTAAMLFDICLGLFIEWNTSTGKLIVLDEAHKYLTNADANRFTKTICSVIRQQRHLAARVIVSTQEPTVVPASVLDLLSWVVCHRFSSPSWVKHLMHHICVEEVESNKADDDLPVPSDWGQRVMVLRTGEALLYSPASLFLSQRGRLATLSSGYAVIKTRPRLTRDGGASLLATQGDSSMALNDLPTPTASNSSTSPAPIASVLGINLRPSSGTSSNSHVLTARASQEEELTGPTSREPAVLSNTAGNKSSLVPPLNVPQEQLSKNAPKTDINSNQPTRNSYAPMLSIMHKFEGIRAFRVIPTAAVQRDSGTPAAISAAGFNSFASFLAQAEKDGVVIKSPGFNHCIELTSSFTSLPAQQAVPPTTSKSPQPPSRPPSASATTTSITTPPQFDVLISTIRQLAPDGQWVKQSNLGIEVAKRDPGCYSRAGFKRLKDLVLAAQKAGLLNARGTQGYEELRLSQ